MSDWTWDEVSAAPPERTIVAKRRATGTVMTFHTKDGAEWTAMVQRARGEDWIEEPITWDEIVRHREQILGE